MVSKSELEHFFETEFPQADFLIEYVSEDKVIIKKLIDMQHLRPGNTISGPTLMEVADAALYVAVLSKSNLSKMALTSNININFLKKPDANQNIVAECSVLKFSQRNAYGEVRIYSEESKILVAHATGAYVIPSTQ
ncbi:PaaI family thioesterase [Vibrio alginolyticus]|uniref:PaaI family thioesterase n=1 Tax=unclassified Vibrio TaxID=2614977 RepID=UPI0025556E1C|nr:MULTISPECIES: PaaI family thioesterase [unclassified Vibrio]ELA9204205.1 PaaI family thioesterase [Vibrio alginolyticus]MDK9730231.1 PaaI family thioesterase [Vibrio sp. D415a]MDK9748801.1 PaaI family thioesterase [Vibrio sp. D409a]MDK9766641.1 PaaI family thioesterase [Vibrio sp. D417a]MDK9788911.1 PaaI family thioesterase [Vibrio sp. D421a]